MPGGRSTTGKRADRVADRRRARGAYSTPDWLADDLAARVLDPLLETGDPARLKILDPACGEGALLAAAYRRLLVADQARAGRSRERADGSRRLARRAALLLRCIHGVDLDARALARARRALAAIALEGVGVPGRTALARKVTIRLARNLRRADALRAPGLPGDRRQRDGCFDWRTEFGAALRRKNPGFDVVVGNPPWGQKRVDVSPARWREMRERFPSTAGMPDLFRPFVELGVRLTRDGGRFAMLLPDVVLQKPYPATRRLLLDALALESIAWWRAPFPGAVVDAATVAGRKGRAPPEHRIRVETRNGARTERRSIAQRAVRDRDGHAFHLHLTPSCRHALAALRRLPRLGDEFEVHEGVHSGNVRSALFVPSRVDASCRPLLVGRGEIAPYRLRWNGRWLRLAAAPERRTREAYCNLGRPEWHARGKVLVRRTGDHLLAAVDREGRHASNNFFVVFPKASSALDLDGLCALLNSRPLTACLRALVPRRGRPFAEVKKKHLVVLPLPPRARDRRELNALGGERARIAEAADPSGASRRRAEHLDARIDALVARMLAISSRAVEALYA